jgi:hypothetical protein
LLKSPDGGGIYLRQAASARNSSVWRGTLQSYSNLCSNASIRLSTAKLTAGQSIPIQVEAAMWSRGGTLDWWAKDRMEWLGRVRGQNGRQKWVKA